MTRETVVVGVDQSVQSNAALQWAVDYARRTGATLRAVSVHPHWKPAMPYAMGAAGLPLVDQGSWDEEAHAAMRSLFDSIRPESHWRLLQVDGAPGPELVRLASDASLLVVGTREHVGMDRFLEGSTSHYCLRHGRIPIVVVPAPELPVAETVMSDRAVVVDPAVI